MKKETLSKIILLTAVMFAACGAKDSTGTDFDKHITEKSVHITNEEDSPCCNVRLELAYAKENGDKKAKLMNGAVARRLFDMEGLTLTQAADSFANSYTRSYTDNIAAMYREDRNDPAKRPWYEYRYNIASEARKGREGVVVYTAAIDYYEGGAHPINQRLVMNFNTATGQQLALGDVFVPGFESTLNERLLNALLQKTGAKDVNELRNKGYLYAMDMFAPENFILDESSITFVYNPYEIASYSEGMIELTLEYDDIKEILKP